MKKINWEKKYVKAMERAYGYRPSRDKILVGIEFIYNLLNEKEKEWIKDIENELNNPIIEKSVKFYGVFTLLKMALRKQLYDEEINNEIKYNWRDKNGKKLC